MIGDFVVAFRFGFFVLVELDDFVVPIGILVNKLLSKSIVSTGRESGIWFKMLAMAVSSNDWLEHVMVTVVVLLDVRSHVQGVMESAGGQKQRRGVRSEKAVESLHVPPDT